MFKRRYQPWCYLDADDGAGGGGAAPPDGKGDPNAGAGDPKPAVEPQKPDKTFSQSELDKIVEDRLARDRKVRDDEARKAKMDEAERLKAEKDEADLKATTATEAANQRIIRADAKIALREKGVSADKLDRALKVLDLSTVQVGDDGEPDAKQIGKAIDALLKDIPEFAGSASAGGADLGNAGGQQPQSDNAKIDELEAKLQKPLETAERKAILKELGGLKTKKLMRQAEKQGVT